MSGEGNIDDIFREKLGGHSVAPSDQVWENIETGLATKRKKGFLFFRWSIIALLICGIAVGGYYGVQNYQSNKEVAALVKTPTEEILKQETDKNKTQLKENEIERGSSVEIESEPVLTENQVSKPSSPKQAPPVAQPINGESAQKNTQTNQRENEEFHAQDSPQNQSAQRIGSTTVGKEISNNTKESNDLQSYANSTEPSSVAESRDAKNEQALEQSSKAQLENTGMELTLDEIQNSNSDTWEWMYPKSVGFTSLAPQLSNKHFEPMNPIIAGSPWSIGLFYEANWNFKQVRATHEGSASLDSLISAEKSTFTSGFGFTVAYQTKAGIRISTGIEYAKWCREAGYPVNLNLPNAATLNPEEEIDKLIYGSTGEQTIYVDNEELGDYENVSPIPDVINFDLNVHECFQTLKIPVRIGYELNLGNWSAVPEIGLAYNRILNSNIEVSENSNLNSLRYVQEKKYNKNALAFNGGLTLERRLTTSLKIGLTGMYGYWITPIYKTEAFKTHPYTFSGRAGIYYTFP